MHALAIASLLITLPLSLSLSKFAPFCAVTNLNFLGFNYTNRPEVFIEFCIKFPNELMSDSFNYFGLGNLALKTNFVQKIVQYIDFKSYLKNLVHSFVIFPLSVHKFKLKNYKYISYALCT